MERGLVKTSDGYIHYRATGEGPPIILLHATPKSSALYLELMEVLGSKLRVVALDTLGYGMSDHPDYPPTVQDYARVVTEVLKSLGIRRASFLGASTGGFIAVELANSYPDLVEKIILLNCPYYFPDEEFQLSHHGPNSPLGLSYSYDDTGFPQVRTMQEALEKDPEHCPMNPTQSWLDRENVALIQAGRGVWKGRDAVNKYSHELPPILERFQGPALGIWGEHFSVEWNHYDEYQRRMKNLQVVMIKGGRYMLAVSHPEEVGHAALDFLQ